MQNSTLGMTTDVDMGDHGLMIQDHSASLGWTFSQLQTLIYWSGLLRTSWKPQWWQRVGIVILWPSEIAGDGRKHKFQSANKGDEIWKSSNQLRKSTVPNGEISCRVEYSLQGQVPVVEQEEAQSSHSKTHCCLVHRKSSQSFRNLTDCSHFSSITGCCKMKMW